MVQGATSNAGTTDYHWLEQNGWPQAITTEHETRMLGLLAMRTMLLPQKNLRNVEGWFHGRDIPLTGYEIHAGISEGPALEKPL